MYHPTDGSWYRKWSDGWLEQGGLLTPTTREKAVTLLKAFKNLQYHINASSNVYVSGVTRTLYDVVDYGSYTISTTTFYYKCDISTANNRGFMTWYACGQGA